MAQALIQSGSVKRRVRAKAKKNKRVKPILEAQWVWDRNKFFRRNVNFAAAAKAYRTAMGITQGELAKKMRRSTQSIANRESGKYSWRGDHEELRDYLHAVDMCAL